jgi:DNA-binding response OmpR family regulator
MALRLALIDADTVFVRALTAHAEASGWRCRTLASPVPVEALEAMRLDAVIVDPTVLGRDAMAYLVRLYARMPDLGVIVCTRPSSAAQRVRGLRLGADDWVTKPCHAEELLARAAAVVRRHRRVEERELAFGEIRLNSETFQAYAHGASAELTRLEYELLRQLAEAEGQVLPRELIYRRVWGYDMVHGDRSVDVFVRKLRTKLERVSPGWRYIHTHFGVGYRLWPQPVVNTAGQVAS